MNYWLARSIDYAIVVPFIAGLIRYKRVDPMFHPFIFFISYIVFNEILFEILVRTIHTNSISSNIYWLVIFFILTFQLKKWGLLGLKRWGEILLYGSVTLAWVAENLYYSSLWSFNSMSIIVICFLLITLIIRAIDGSADKFPKLAYRNIVYLISGTLVFQFAVRVLIEIFVRYGLILSDSFQINIVDLGSLVSLVVYTLNTIAIIWMPRKREYTWLSP